MSAKNNSPIQTASGGKTKGYQKIADAAAAMGVIFRNKTLLDIGASTGGFTAYALERGAKRVIAIEKGTNQMVAPLRFDPRVDLYEKTDIFTLKPGDIPNPDLVLADVSFISLTRVLSFVKQHLSSPKTRFLVMLKPQFEARPDQLKNGVVKNSKTRRDIIKNFEIWLKNHGFYIIQKADNHVAGRSGNLERFYYLSREP